MLPFALGWDCHAWDKGSVTEKLWLKDRINHIPCFEQNPQAPAFRMKPQIISSVLLSLDSKEQEKHMKMCVHRMKQ